MPRGAGYGGLSAIVCWVQLVLRLLSMVAEGLSPQLYHCKSLATRSARFAVTQFEEAVALALGGAIVQLSEHEARPFREIIPDICLHSKAYDP